MFDDMNKNTDVVNHPDHYKSETGMEVIDVIEAFTFDLKGIEATDTGNILKYICRWSKKNGLQDLKKAEWYLKHLIEHVEKLENENNKQLHSSTPTDLDDENNINDLYDDAVKAIRNYREHGRLYRVINTEGDLYVGVHFSTESNAHRFMNTLICALINYGSISLFDLYNLLGQEHLTVYREDEGYFWDSLVDARIEKELYEYVIKLPKAKTRKENNNG